jgi:hypothetical protein
MDGRGVERESGLMGEEDGGDERRAPGEGTDEDAEEDHELGEGDKVHGLVVVALDPDLDLASDVVGPVGRRALLAGRDFRGELGEDIGAEEGGAVEEREGREGEDGDVDGLGDEPGVSEWWG